MIRIYNIEKSRHNLSKGQAIFNALVVVYYMVEVKLNNGLLEEIQSVML